MQQYFFLLYLIPSFINYSNISLYSKTPIYRGVWGQGNIRGTSGFAVNRGFVWLTLYMFSPIWGNEMAAVYRGLR